MGVLGGNPSRITNLAFVLLYDAKRGVRNFKPSQKCTISISRHPPHVNNDIHCTLRNAKA